MGSLAPTLVSILQSRCPYLGSDFSSSGSNRIVATSHSPAPRTLFAKMSKTTKRDRDRVLGEAQGLAAMEAACREAGMNVDKDEGIVPRVHAWGEEEGRGRAYLVTDYIERGGSSSSAMQRSLGLKLAQMHKAGITTTQRDPQAKGKGHGFPVPTHCGATEMDNTWEKDWPTFFAERRIGDIVRRIGDSGLSKLEDQLREHVYPLLLEPLRDVKPTILHGDLWGGNYIVDDKGQPFVFDPSAYYGHSECDLGMTTCFGGYGAAFYEAYHSVLPKTEPYYEHRIQLYALFHWLNHELMFGAYRSTAVRSAEGLIAWAKKEAASNGGKGRKAEL